MKNIIGLFLSLCIVANIAHAAGTKGPPWPTPQKVEKPPDPCSTKTISSEYWSTLELVTRLQSPDSNKVAMCAVSPESLDFIKNNFSPPAFPQHRTVGISSLGDVDSIIGSFKIYAPGGTTASYAAPGSANEACKINGGKDATLTYQNASGGPIKTKALHQISTSDACEFNFKISRDELVHNISFKNEGLPTSIRIQLCDQFGGDDFNRPWLGRTLILDFKPLSELLRQLPKANETLSPGQRTPQPTEVLEGAYCQESQ